jgi:hypothetical protein
MKRLSALFILLGLTIVPLSMASAAVMQKSDDKGMLAVSVPVKDDVYLVGDKVTVAQTVEGDVIAAGSDVQITGKVTGDIAVAGGNVTLAGAVSDDVRAAGGTVRISGAVGGDLLVAGGTVIIDATANIGGDLVVYGGEVTMLGKVGRNLKISAENATLLGAVGGTLMVNAESLHTGTDVKGASTLHAKTITLEKTAAFGSPVSYWREGGNMDFGGALRNGATATYDESAAAVGKDTSKMGAAAFLGVFSVYSLLSGMLIIGLLLLITRTFFSDLAKQLKTEPGWSLLYGLMYLVLVPAIAFIAMLTLIGLPLGILMIAMYVFSFVFVTPLASIAFAKLLQLQYKTKWGTASLFFVSTGIFIVLKLIGWVPFVGWMVKFALLLAVLGALCVVKYDRYLEVR